MNEQMTDTVEQEPKPTPEPERKWKSSAGPVQSNKVRKAITAINTEGRTFVERYGVIGGESSDHVLFSPFSPPRAEAGVAWKELGDRFGWQVTRENYADIITAAGELVERLKSSRQVNDCRRTAEQQAEMDRKAQEREERDQAEREKREQERQAAEQARGTALTGGKPVVVRYNKEHNGIEVLFPEKPGADVRNVLKGMGMRWSRFSGVWYTRYTPDMWATVNRAMGLGKVPEPVTTQQGPDRFDMAVEDRMAEQCGLEAR